MKECGLKEIQSKVYIEDNLFLAMQRKMEKHMGGKVSKVLECLLIFPTYFILETSREKNTQKSRLRR